MGVVCSKKKVIEHEFQVTETFTLSKRVRFAKRLDHSNINGGRKIIFLNPEAQCTSLSEVRSRQETCALTRAHDSDKPRRMGNPVRLLMESFSEAKNRLRETLDVSQLDASFEKAAIVSAGQKKSWPLQDEDGSAFLGLDFNSQFISESEQLTTPRIIFPDDGSHKLQVRNFLSLANVSSPRTNYSSYTTSSTYAPIPITEVIPGKLYLGNEDNASSEEQLLALGITHVLSVTNSINRIQGIEHEHFVMNDWGRTELKTVLKRVYPFMERAQQAEKKLFVYCKLGQNRSPTVVISFLMKKKGLTLYQAHKKLKKQRPVVQIHHNYAKMLLRLESELYGETSLPDDWMEQDGCSLQGIPLYKSEQLTFEEQQSFKASQKLQKISNCTFKVDYTRS